MTDVFQKSCCHDCSLSAAGRSQEVDVAEACVVDPADVVRKRAAQASARAGVEGRRTGRHRAAGDDCGHERERGRHLAERDECAEHRQHRGDERDRQRAVPDRRQAFEPKHGPEGRRVVLVVRRRVAGERDARREQQQPGREQADGDPTRQPALDVETERDCQQRDEREEVALLEALRVRVSDLGRFEEQATREDDASSRQKRARRACGAGRARPRARPARRGRSPSRWST